MRRLTKGSALMLLMGLLGTACAGEVGRYRNDELGLNPVAGAGAAASAAGGVEADQRMAPAADSGHPTATSSAGPEVRQGTTALTSGPGAARPFRPTSAPVSTGPFPRPAAAAPPAGRAADPGVSSLAGAPRTDPEPTRPGAPVAVPSGGTTTGLTRDTITIGLFYPKTGAYAGLFRNTAVAAQAALDEAGPINGRRLVLKTYDDGTADAATIQLEEKRAKDEVFAVLSAISESNAVLAPLANQHHVPLIVGNIDEKVALPLTYVFPVLPFWTRQATILPGFIQNVLSGGGKRIGIVYEGTSTAIDAKKTFKAKAGEVGLHVVFEQPIAQNQSACANEVANLQAHQVELVFMMNGPLGAICMLRDARALAYHPIWTGVGTSWSANVVATASGGGADGVRMLASGVTLETPPGRHYSEVMRRYAPDSAGADDEFMYFYYALFQTFLEGFRRAGPALTREGFVHTFETAMNGYESGYLPPPTFGPGNRSGPLGVGVVACCTGGRWTTIQTGWRTSF